MEYNSEQDIEKQLKNATLFSIYNKKDISINFKSWCELYNVKPTIRVFITYLNISGKLLDYGEVNFNKNMMVPVPGTRQADYLVKII